MKLLIKYLNWISLIISLLAISMVIYYHMGSTKIVYIKTGDVLQKFVGLKEANAIYENKMTTSQGQMDTIISEYKKKTAEFDKVKNTLSKSEREKQEQALMEEAGKIKNYNAASKEELAKDNEQLLTGVLNQVNAFAEIYAKEKGYDLVIGTTSAGNLMYGDESYDVTEDFTKRLNDYYKKGL
jgi:outer membrane protein